MLTKEQNDRLTRVGRSTPCGELMRRYWHPVAASAHLPQRGVRSIRLLGEDLILYRSKEGELGLLEPRCPHRRANLIYGIPEDKGLRCAYHGWMFDRTGRCIDQPFEAFCNPKTRFKEEITIKAYPVQELGGVIFAYLGPEPAPLLPRWEPFVIDGVFREVGMAVVPCNWLQTVENAGDTSHVVTAHFQYSSYVLENIGRSDLIRHENSSGALGYYMGKPRKIEDHGVGAIIFPYTDAQSDITYQMRVPIDDENTLHIWYTTFDEEAQKELGVDLPKQAAQTDIPFFDVPVPRAPDQRGPDWPLLDSNCAQDMALWCSQGRIFDRTKEALSVGDRNIVLFRKLLEQQIKLVEEGRDPINTFRDPAKNKCLVPRFKLHMRPRTAPDGRPDLTNGARKYSPVYRWSTIAQLGDSALDEPVH